MIFSSRRVKLLGQVVCTCLRFPQTTPALGHAEEDRDRIPDCVSSTSYQQLPHLLIPSPRRHSRTLRLSSRCVGDGVPRMPVHLDDVGDGRTNGTRWSSVKTISRDLSLATVPVDRPGARESKFDKRRDRVTTDRPLSVETLSAFRSTV